MIKQILELYGYGYDIEAIAYDLDLTEQKVYSLLRSWKRRSKLKVGYKQELYDKVIERNQNGFGVTKIERELKCGGGDLLKMFKKEGIQWNQSEKLTLKDEYEVIQHDSFTICPDCHKSKGVRDLSINDWEDAEERSRKKRDKTIKNSFCIDCTTEWYEEDGEVRKVLFHQLII